jgi:hypothetical protein
MNEIFLKAIEKLTDPLAIVLIVSMAANILLVVTVSRVLPKVYQVLGKQTALIEILVYGRKGGPE